ncbi:pectin acetylesterase 7 [Nicotiana attenuata]|uniref:Pectin acetylesterase n=2 Tax=Nicotiana attenuata TaxID=49451 RepID=A0A314KQZ3_NICAT|nr:pectin acetylesterase 7 [Nicotiana attenuata]
MATFFLALLALSAMLTAIMAQSPQELIVNITILHSATAEGAVCLDGSAPAYHLGQGYDFYNWNRVRVRYYDGSSFTGDIEDVDPDTKFYYRGARIFRAIMNDLSRKGMQKAENAILSGTSAGGLATILNCDKFKSFFPVDVRVKCVPDAGFFINAKTISGTSDIQDEYKRVVNLHGSAKNLPPSCTSRIDPSLCFFPQNVVPHVKTPLFMIKAAYDSWQE